MGNSVEKLNNKLFDACREGHLNEVKDLIEKGADIHAENDYALREASRKGRLQVVKYLVEAGANIHSENNYASRWAARGGHLKVVKYLVDKGANIHIYNNYALREASYYGHFEIVKYLVEKGANIHAQNDYALRWASRQGHHTIAEYLKTIQPNEIKQPSIGLVFSNSENKQPSIDLVLSKINVEPTNEEENQCNYCLVNRKNICFIPCGHVTACKNCAKEIIAKGSKCPTCKTEIANVNKIYY